MPRSYAVGVIAILLAAAIFLESRQATSFPKHISAAVVPHHDLVKAQRQDFFIKLSQAFPAPKTVILISPNHFDAGRSDVQTTNQVWQTAQGKLEPDASVIAALLGTRAVSQEPTSFTDEHGIRLLLGDIQQAFPRARLVPLIFKIETPLLTIQTVEAALEHSCSDCLLLASVDFSHYQPALLANQHDNLTLRALQALDQNALMNSAETDSPPSLTLLAQWARRHNTLHFNLWKHTNSGELLHDSDLETTTHFFGWYEAGASVRPDPSVSFLLGGDMMFGRMIAHTFLRQGLNKSLDQLGERVFWGSDAAGINLEGPISDTPVPDDYLSSKLIFHFPPQAVAALRYLHINAASLANNHSANAGVEGLLTTRALLMKAGIAPVGGPAPADIEKVVTISGSKLKLVIVGVHALIDVPDLAPLIARLKQDPDMRVLMFPHWGNEYQGRHSSRQEQLAHAWIDAGADVVVGSHPHVIQDTEVYRGKPIIYSLGNLLFDQNFSQATQQGLLLAGNFTDKGLQLFGLPVQSVKYKPQLMRGAAKRAILDRLYQPLAAYRQPTPAGEVLFFPR